MIILSLIQIESIKKYDFKQHTFLNNLGDASYSLYLIHYPMGVVIAKIFIIAHLDRYTFFYPLYFIFFVSFAVVIAILFNKLIEKSMLNYLNKNFVKKENKQ